MESTSPEPQKESQTEQTSAIHLDTKPGITKGDDTSASSLPSPWNRQEVIRDRIRPGDMLVPSLHFSVQDCGKPAALQTHFTIGCPGHPRPILPS